MNDRDRKRHEERKARRRAILDDREPELRGTRMAVLPLDDEHGSQARRLEIDATDPLDVVVRWGRRAMLEAAPDRVLRVLTVTNWDDDPRELYAIPVTAGCMGYAALMAAAPQLGNLAAVLCIGLIFGFRAAAIRWRLRVPDWFRLEGDRPEP